MSRKNRMMCLLLMAALTLSMLAGCMSQDKLNETVYHELQGTWRTEVPCSDQTTRELLENIDLSEEEIALLELGGPKLVKIATFDEGTYRFDIDTDAVRDNVRGFYADVFNVLYESRTELNEVYSQTFDDMAQADFEAFYAELYGYEDLETMLDDFARNAFDYEAMAVVETGVYTAERKDMIYCTPDQSTASEGTLRFSVAGDAMNLAFADGDEVYKRITE